jgi:hypothetical protein
VSYRTQLIDNLFFVRWQKPVLEDIDTLIVESIAARGKTQLPLVTISMIPEDSAAPDAQFRKRVVEKWDQMVPRGELVHAIIEGDGLKATLHRTILRAMRMLLPKRRNVGGIHSSLEQCLRSMRVREPQIILDELRAGGMLSDPAQSAAQP